MIKVEKDWQDYFILTWPFWAVVLILGWRML